MQNFISYLHTAHDNLSDLLGEPRVDWENPYHTMTDEQLESMGRDWQEQHLIKGKGEIERAFNSFQYLLVR